MDSLFSLDDSVERNARTVPQVEYRISPPTIAVTLCTVDRNSTKVRCSFPKN